MADLVRYVRRTAVLPIAAAYAVATATVLFAFEVVQGFVLLPAVAGSGSVGELSSLNGYGSVGGRLVLWLTPAESGLALLMLLAGALLAARLRDGRARDAECPLCRSPIPLAAAICRACRREVRR